MSIISN